MNNNNPLCLPCPNNCKNCSSGLVCETCVFGYILDYASGKCLNPINPTFICSDPLKGVIDLELG